MKKLFLALLIVSFVTNHSFSQNVGIGTNQPHSSAILELSSPNKGFLPPRLTTLQRDSIVNPAEGLLIFNTGTKCVEVFILGGWRTMYCYEPPQPLISLLDCASAFATPEAIVPGLNYSGVILLPYFGGNGIDYAAGSPVASTGVTGLTAALQAGTLSNGAGNLAFNVSGVASADGVASFNIVFGGQSCTINLNTSSPSISSLDCSGAQYSPKPIAAGQNYTGIILLPYSGGNGVPYPAGSPVSSTGVTGLTATLQTGTLTTGSGNLLLNVSGTPSSNGLANFQIDFGGKNCSVSILVGPNESLIIGKWQWINFADSIFFISSTCGRTSSAYAPEYITNYAPGIFYDLKANGIFDLLVTSNPAQNRSGTYTYSSGILGLLFSGSASALNYPVVGLNLTELKIQTNAAYGIRDTFDLLDPVSNLPVDGTIDSVDVYDLTRTRKLARSS